MWRKPSNAKPSPQTPEVVKPASSVPVATAPAKPEPVTPVATATPTAQPVAAPPPAIPVAAPPMPAYQGPASRMVVAHDTPAASSLGTGLKIRGELSGSSDLYIDGEAQGKITLPDSRVTIGPNGRVQADIEAREIVIEGSVQGNLKAGENIRLASSSSVQGSIVTPRVGIDDGAKLRGKVEMVRQGDPKAAQGFTTSEKSGDKSVGSPVLKAVATSSKGE